MTTATNVTLVTWSALSPASVPLADAQELLINQPVSGVNTQRRVSIAALRQQIMKPGSRIAIAADGTISAQGTMWWTSVGAPPNTQGIAGDYDLDVMSGNIYVNVGGHWSSPVGCLLGPQGLGSSGTPTGTAVAGAPRVTTIGAADLVSVSVNGIDHSITLANFLAGGTAAWTAGDAVNAAAIVAETTRARAAEAALTTITALPAGTAPSASDSVVMVQSGAADLVPYATVMDGQTVSQLSAASAASDTDTFPVSQGGTALVAQTMSAVSTYIRGKVPGYGMPTRELSSAGASVTIDATYNGCIIIVSAANVTIKPSYTGSGFYAVVITTAAGTVNFGAGWVMSSGVSSLTGRQSASLYAFTYSGGSGGTMYFAATGGQGSSSTTTYTAPGVPTSVGVVTATSSTLALSWIAPAGSTVTSYTVQYRVAGTSAWTLAYTTSATITLTSLTANTSYNVAVSAVNVSASSAATATVSYSTTALFAPNVPTSLASSTTTTSSLAFLWSAAAQDGTHSAATSYTVNYRQTGASAWIAYGSSVSGTSVTLTGLTAGTGYDIEVAASNAAGSSAFVSLLNTQTPTVLAAPGVPTGLTAGTATSASVPLNWTAPTTGGAVATYTVQYRVTGTTPWTQVTGISGTAYTVAGLSGTTGYDFQVQAVNATAASAFTATTTATTLALAAPGVPTGLTAGTATNTSVPLSWVAPAGSTVATYTVQYRVTGTTPWTQVTGISGTAYTVAGLSGTTGYDFQVQAVNATAASAFTATTTATTLALAAPGVPTGASFNTSTTTTLALSWVAPAGSTVTSYTVQYRITGTGTWTQISTTATNVTLTSLASSTSYDVEVCAVNGTASSAFTSSISDVTSAPSSGTSIGSYTYTLAFGTTDSQSMVPTTPVSHTGTWPDSGLNFHIVGQSSPPSGISGFLVYSTQNTTVPATTGSNANSCGSFGAADYGAYCSPPATAGTWYVFAVLKDGSGNVQGAYVSTAITVT